MRGRPWAIVAVSLAFAGPWAGVAGADDVKVLCAGAVRSVVSELAATFRQEAGHSVSLSFGTVGVNRKKLMGGEPVDVVILTDVAIDEVTAAGAVVPGSRADIARTGMGLAVREGAPRPDISTPDAFKQTLLAARSLVYVDPAQGATSGIHFAGVLARLGIADAVKAKTQLVPGGYPAEKVASGEVEMVVHQISEIVPVKGVVLVGPLPGDLQKVTVYSAGLASRSASPAAGRAFIAFLTRPAFRPKFAAAGLDYKP
ncbi:MAG TPA: substrate-binding domain-containing protein [Methylomirabilota bacterium]|nr:substrate-binding domain-containing protein [Methylomirabilota bacterium]